MNAIGRALEVYRNRGLRELLARLGHQLPYQVRERVFGSRAYMSARHRYNSLRYKTVDDPFELGQVDPAAIEYFSARGVDIGENIAQSRWQDIGKVVGGDWDLKSKSSEYAIENELLYRAIEDHFDRDVPWEETEYVRNTLERLRQGEHDETWRAVVRSEEDLWERCEQLEHLYERINTDGYKSKQEVFDSRSSDPMGYYPRTYKYTLDEVMVDRGRMGEPLLVDGLHRLFIAKVCGIEEIPVLVVVRHLEYVDSG